MKFGPHHTMLSLPRQSQPHVCELTYARGVVCEMALSSVCVTLPRGVACAVVRKDAVGLGGWKLSCGAGETSDRWELETTKLESKSRKKKNARRSALYLGSNKVRGGTLAAAGSKEVFMMFALKC